MIQQPTTLSFGQRVIIACIRLYQKTLSPDHGPLFSKSLLGCRYYPSCSEYTIRAVAFHGILRGLSKSLWRILRCNPFSHGGIDDPTPNKLH